VQVVHVIARVVLGVVFVAAGASKIASGPAWPTSAAQFGVPAVVARFVPWFELVVGAVVAVGVGQPASILVAIATLVAFSAVLLHSLRLGRQPPCACFGTLSATPLGWGHVWRNVAFMALGVTALVTG
jgi:uncharacterized membrane protein YphA (DoxX/SURF4 family)